mmetsp:Transcript_21767/g.61593  ORF Transcript_21767/g.61593 Transcript_21767/m.61593 type:complete len:241 (-) Transcript_21767:274-996(-)
MDQAVGKLRGLMSVQGPIAVRINLGEDRGNTLQQVWLLRALLVDVELLEGGVNLFFVKLPVAVRIQTADQLGGERLLEKPTRRDVRIENKRGIVQFFITQTPVAIDIRLPEQCRAPLEEVGILREALQPPITGAVHHGRHELFLADLAVAVLVKLRKQHLGSLTAELVVVFSLVICALVFNCDVRLLFRAAALPCNVGCFVNRIAPLQQLRRLVRLHFRCQVLERLLEPLHHRPVELELV